MEFKQKVVFNTNYNSTKHNNAICKNQINSNLSTFIKQQKQTIRDNLPKTFNFKTNFINNLDKHSLHYNKHIDINENSNINTRKLQILQNKIYLLRNNIIKKISNDILSDKNIPEHSINVIEHFKSLNINEQKEKDILCEDDINTFIYLGNINDKLNDYIIVGLDNGWIKLINITNNKTIKRYIEHTNYIVDISFKTSNNNNLFLSCDNDNAIKLWNINNIKSLKTYQNNTFYISCLSTFENIKNYFLSGDCEGFIKLWNISTGEIKTKIKICNSSVKTIFNYSEDLFITGHFGELFLWNINTFNSEHNENDNKYIFKYEREHNDWIKSIVKYKNEYFITGSNDKSFKLWNINYNYSIYSFYRHYESINSLLVINDILVTTGKDKTMKLTDLISKGPIISLPVNQNIQKIITYKNKNKLKIIASSGKWLKIFE